MANDSQRAWAMAGVGMEMVVPVLIGWWLDSKFGWTPWGILVSGVIGFAAAISHVIILTRQEEAAQKKRKPPTQTGSP